MGAAARARQRPVSRIAASALATLSGDTNAGTPSRFIACVTAGACGLTNATTGLSVPGKASRTAPAISSGMPMLDEPAITATASYDGLSASVRIARRSRSGCRPASVTSIGLRSSTA